MEPSSSHAIQSKPDKSNQNQTDVIKVCSNFTVPIATQQNKFQAATQPQPAYHLKKFKQIIGDPNQCRIISQNQIASPQIQH